MLEGLDLLDCMQRTANLLAAELREEGEIAERQLVRYRDLVDRLRRTRADAEALPAINGHSGTGSDVSPPRILDQALEAATTLDQLLVPGRDGAVTEHDRALLRAEQGLKRARDQYLGAARL